MSLSLAGWLVGDLDNSYRDRWNTQGTPKKFLGKTVSQGGRCSAQIRSLDEGEGGDV